MMCENNLIERAIEGERSSLSNLLEVNYPIVYGFLLKISLHEEIAKDITQETMVKAITNIKKFRGDCKFSSWLIMIGINIYKNQIKQNKYNAKWQDAVDHTLPSLFSVEDYAERRIDMEKVLNALKKMKSMDRLIFILKYYEGYDYNEICKITGIKVGTCKSKMHYLIQKLKTILEVDYHEEM